MAKKTISRLSVLAVLIVFLAACSKTSEYTNVIPADASVLPLSTLNPSQAKRDWMIKRMKLLNKKYWKH